MPLRLTPLHPVFTAEADGIDLTRPLSDTDVRAINAAMNQYAVLVWRGQPLTGQQQIDFAKSFGPLDLGLKKVFNRPERLEDERLIDISNVDAQGNVARRDSPKNLSNFANQLWHSDSSFQNPRAAYSMLHALVLPSWGGTTEFADLRAAYDALPDAMKRRLGGLVAWHSLMTSRAKLGFSDFDETEKKAFEPVPQVLVRRLQDSGRMSLYLASHAGAISGLSKADAEALLKELIEHATQRQFVYSHRWRVNDLVMWDDRCTMHRGLEFDDQRFKRDMRRATVSDVAPTCEQMGLAVAAE